MKATTPPCAQSLLGWVVLHLQPLLLPSGLLVPAERQLVSYPANIAETPFHGSWAIGVWARKVASQSCLCRDKPDGRHLATKEMCITTGPPAPPINTEPYGLQSQGVIRAVSAALPARTRSRCRRLYPDNGTAFSTRRSFRFQHVQTVAFPV